RCAAKFQGRFRGDRLDVCHAAHSVRPEQLLVIAHKFYGLCSTLRSGTVSIERPDPIRTSTSTQCRCAKPSGNANGVNSTRSRKEVRRPVTSMGNVAILAIPLRSVF